MVFSFAVLSQVATAQAATNVYVNPAQTNVNLGGSFAVSVDINTDASVYAAQFDLYFDKTRLNATGITEGSFLKQGGISTFCASLAANNSLGKITYACTRFGTTTGATGTASMLGINFSVLSAGTSTLGLDAVTLVNPNLQAITASIANGTVKINRLPSASNLQITPANPVTTDNLVGSYTYSDPDGDPENGTDIRWYKDAVLQSAYNNQLTVPSSATARNQKWYFTVKPKDGIGFGNLQTSANATIQNSPPTAPVVNVTPDLPLTTDNLVCNASVSTDADGDAITYSYKWYKNGILQPALTGNIIPSALTNKSQVWNCSVTPSDGAASGPSAKDEVTIQNTGPSIISFSPANATIKTREGFSLQFNHTSSDADADPLTYSWKLNGTQKATTPSWLYSPTTADCGSRGVSLTVSDGLLTAAKSWVATVGLQGDVDGNRKVDIFDLAATGLAYGSAPGNANWNANADINPGPSTDGTPEGNGQINIFDLATVGLNYGRTC